MSGDIGVLLQHRYLQPELCTQPCSGLGLNEGLQQTQNRAERTLANMPSKSMHVSRFFKVWSNSEIDITPKVPRLCKVWPNSKIDVTTKANHCRRHRLSISASKTGTSASHLHISAWPTLASARVSIGVMNTIRSLDTVTSGIGLTLTLRQGNQG